ncbi:MAG: FAD:protein FMN transferase [Planctomycetes bacterium]|nr:FAD:protein FMN transferase [Planctomycetota bacterium]
MRHLGWLLLILCACRATPSESAQRYRFEHVAMGTSWSLVVHAPDAARAERAAKAAFRVVDEVDEAANDYDAASELSRLVGTSAGDARSVSPLLFELLVEARAFAELTDGAFDPTCGRTTKLWRRARRQAELPSDARIEAALATCGYDALELDAAHHAVRLRREGMQLDLGGVAKGQALDRALDAVRAEGLERVLIEGGGDLRAGAAPPGAAAWIVALEGSRARVALVDAGMATSGDAYRGFELDGVTYSHLIDPRTGRAVTDRRTVTVIAPTAAEADAFASAACVASSPRLDAWFGPDSERSARVVTGGTNDPWLSPRWSEHRIADDGTSLP